MKPYRKIIALLIWLLSLSPAANAQAHYNGKVSIGAHAGVTMSTVSFTPSTKESMLMGQMAGLQVKYWEERNFGLLAEINFVQSGWKENFQGAPFEFSRTLNYVRLPIMTNIFFGGRKFNGFVNLGPEIGYLLSSSSSANFDVNNPYASADFPDNRETDQLTLEPSNRFDYGITAGAGFEFIIKRRHRISLEGRYYFGIGNIFPDDRKDTFSASRNSTIMIMLGYSFRLK
ncbi:MAG: PorT family protein [Muribaculum sp.]|nr:PorT family protein [Muribaculaceae bacterium]MCM1080710.1 PorT family protein [Muribaculum sp.]